MSIFVNPTQFNDPADLAAYPRDERRGRRSGRVGAGVDLLFVPGGARGLPARVHRHGEPARADRRGAGGSAPWRRALPGRDHGGQQALGMAAPDRAYFGQKDAQQVRVVQAMVADLNIATEIVAVPTVREPDGLAMSSRNRRLSPFDRARAAHISAALRDAEVAVSNGIVDAGAVVQTARKVLIDNAIDVEYLELVDADTFLPVRVLVAGPASSRWPPWSAGSG